MSAKRAVIVVRSASSGTQKVVFPKRFAAAVSAIYGATTRGDSSPRSSSGEAKDGANNAPQ